MSTGAIIFMALIINYILACVTGSVASEKGISWWGGFWLGMLLGILGVAIILVMPRRYAPVVSARAPEKFRA